MSPELDVAAGAAVSLVHRTRSLAFAQTYSDETSTRSPSLEQKRGEVDPGTGASAASAVRARLLEVLLVAISCLKERRNKQSSRGERAGGGQGAFHRANSC